MNWMIHHSVAWCLGAHLLSPTVPYAHTITKISCQNHINPVLVASIIAQESRFNPGKRRYERGIHDTSIGLMQITTRTARWIGFHGPVRRLYNPWVNITYGTRFLALLLQKHPYGSDAIAAYNAGKPRWRHGGYVNSRGSHNVERYVLRVESWSRHYRIMADREYQSMVALAKKQQASPLMGSDGRILAWFNWPPGTLYPNIGGRMTD